MRQLVPLVLILLFVTCGFAQRSWSQKDSLQSVLRSSLSGTTRVNRLLDLGHLYIVKPGEQTSDLDTALLLIKPVSYTHLTLPTKA